jgi:hypothetical protein
MNVHFKNRTACNITIFVQRENTCEFLFMSYLKEFFIIKEFKYC